MEGISMKLSSFFVVLLGFASCKPSQWNELRMSNDSAPKIFTLVSRQDTSIKEDPAHDSGPKAGKICKISKGTKILIQGYTKFADGSHVQIFLTAIQSMASNSSLPPVQSGEPTIVPASKSSAPGSSTPATPVRITEPKIVTVLPDSVDPFHSEDTLRLSDGAPNATGSSEVSSMECPLLGKLSYIYSEHFDGLSSAEPPMDALFEGYDRDWGNRIASLARNQHEEKKYSGWGCYMFVADVLERALGRIPNWQPLNRGSCARSFSDGWSPRINEREFGLRKIETRDPNIVDKLPVGSVLVTGRCGLQSLPGVCEGPGYGDIMIKGDEEGTMYSAINGPPKSDKCGIRSGNLIAVFIPIK